MAKRKYFKEHIDYLREISPGRYNDEITRMFNEKFGMNATKAAVQTLKAKNKITSGVVKIPKQYTIEQLAYLQKLSAQGLFNAEITRRFNERFGTSRTENAIQQQRIKYGIKTTARHYWPKGHRPWNKGMRGVIFGGKETQFKKGDMPQAWVPVGSETVTKDGYLKVKVANPNRWEYKQRLIWEKHHGRKVPGGHVVIFGDGDKRNFDVDNLILVSRAELVRMNQMDLIKNDADLTRTGIIIARIRNKMGKRKKVARRKGAALGVDLNYANRRHVEKLRGRERGR